MKKRKKKVGTRILQSFPLNIQKGTCRGHSLILASYRIVGSLYVVKRLRFVHVSLPSPSTWQLLRILRSVNNTCFWSHLIYIRWKLNLFTKSYTSFSHISVLIEVLCLFVYRWVDTNKCLMSFDLSLIDIV